MNLGYSLQKLQLFAVAAVHLQENASPNQVKQFSWENEDMHAYKHTVHNTSTHVHMMFCVILWIKMSKNEKLKQKIATTTPAAAATATL